MLKMVCISIGPGKRADCFKIRWFQFKTFEADLSEGERERNVQQSWMENKMEKNICCRQYEICIRRKED